MAKDLLAEVVGMACGVAFPITESVLHSSGTSRETAQGAVPIDDVLPIKLGVDVEEMPAEDETQKGNDTELVGLYDSFPSSLRTFKQDFSDTRDWYVHGNIYENQF